MNQKNFIRFLVYFVAFLIVVYFNSFFLYQIIPPEYTTFTAMGILRMIIAFLILYIFIGVIPYFIFRKYGIGPLGTTPKAKIIGVIVMVVLAIIAVGIPLLFK